MAGSLPSGWPSGWNVYYVVFLSALLALSIPAVLSLVSSLVSTRPTRAHPPRPPQGLDVPGASKVSLGKRINTRFFLSANVALVLITLALLLIPFTGAVRADVDRPALFRALVGIVTLALFAALSLLYSARKGDLEWLRSYRKGPGA